MFFLARQRAHPKSKRCCMQPSNSRRFRVTACCIACSTCLGSASCVVVGGSVACLMVWVDRLWTVWAMTPNLWWNCLERLGACVPGEFRITFDRPLLPGAPACLTASFHRESAQRCAHADGCQRKRTYLGGGAHIGFVDSLCVHIVTKYIFFQGS